MARKFVGMEVAIADHAWSPEEEFELIVVQSRIIVIKTRRSIIIVGLFGLMIYFGFWLALLYLYERFYTPVYIPGEGNLVVSIEIAKQGLAVAMGIVSIIWTLKRPKDYLVSGIYFAPLLIHGLVTVFWVFSKVLMEFFHK